MNTKTETEKTLRECELLLEKAETRSDGDGYINLEFANVCAQIAIGKALVTLTRQIERLGNIVDARP